MADRSVVYRLIADATQFKAGMTQAAAASRTAGTQMETTATKTGKLQAGMAGLGVSATVAGAALGAKVVSTAANFEQAMSGIQAATHATSGEMDALKDAALEAGASTAFSATEAAAGIENLSKAGVSTADILGGGLQGALDLAAAGNMEVAAASELAATALTQFNLAGEDVPHVADLLAAGAGKAQGEVSDLGMALNQSGLVASQMGLSIEETTGTLSAFASAGLLGSDAGTSFRTMLLRMANPTKESAALMKQLGINAYDASGQFVGTAALAGQLQTAFRGMDQATRDAAMATIFGSDAIRGANVLYTQGEAGISGWTSAVDDAGYAAETAEIRMDNLKGALEELSGAIETQMIRAGESALPALTALADAATLATDAFGKVDAGLQKVTGGAQSIATVAGGPLTMFGSVFGNIKDAVTGSTDAQEKNTEATKDTKGATQGATQAAADYAERVKVVEERSRKQAEAAREQAKAIREARQAARTTGQSFVNLGDSLDDAKVSLSGWLREMEQNADALRNFRQNAITAAKRGLKEGLIRELQNAGAEGARRMRQLANATDAEMDRANRAWERGQAEMRRWVNFKVPPKRIDVETSAAMSGINNLEQRLRSIADEDVFVNVRHREYGRNTMGPVSRATGGPIYGPGTATSDSIPAWLSNGEHVWTAREVANAGGHAAVEALRSQYRYAQGGAVGAASSAPRVNVGGARVQVLIDGREVRAIVRSEMTADRDFERQMSRG